MTLNEKASYIKGLADGLEIDKESKEGKVIAALLDLVGEMTEAITCLADDVDELNDYIEEIDEDLGSVEEVLCEYEDDEYDDEFDCDGDCDECDCCCEDEDFFEVECPACGEEICFDSTVDPEELRCPACGAKFECLVSEEDLDAIDAE